MGKNGGRLAGSGRCAPSLHPRAGEGGAAPAGVRRPSQRALRASRQRPRLTAVLHRRCPLARRWLRRRCVVCQTPETPAAYVCPTPDCAAVYCRPCWDDVRRRCPACTPREELSSSAYSDSDDDATYAE